MHGIPSTGDAKRSAGQDQAVRPDAVERGGSVVADRFRTCPRKEAASGCGVEKDSQEILGGFAGAIPGGCQATWISAHRDDTTE